MSRSRILVIEDNSLNLELVTDVLQAADYVVFQATNATDGLRMARETAPDLILMDVGLPDMDGLSAARELKLDPATHRVPLIALTAHAMKGDEEAAMRQGCDGYLTKPINTQTFAATIGGFLARFACNTD